MTTFLFYLSIITLIFFIFLFIDQIRGSSSLRFLKDFPAWEGNYGPKVSVIIPARNEERNIEQALNSMFKQDYQNLEIIMVDDRSTDQTGNIIDRLATYNPRLLPIHLKELPKGWLGKNHALYTGARKAAGKYILFTDADVVMESTTLGRAIRYMEENNWDHMALGPVPEMKGVLLNIFMGVFPVFFAIFARPWKASDPKSKKFIGIGAFNLVRRDVYEAVGTIQVIAMRPDDDIMLGKLVKKYGYKQRLLFGKGLISVEWYSSFGELVRGLEKNSYAGVNYSLSAMSASLVSLLVFFVWPWAGIFVTRGLTQYLNLVIVSLLSLVFLYSAHNHNGRKILFITFPIGVLMFAYILLRATILTYVHGGIYWRDTYYPLNELKANKV